MNIKRIIALLLAPIALILVGCTAAASSTEPTDLTGSWSYTKDDVSFDATVEGSVIDIYLTLNDTEGLYWSGTFEKEAVDGLTISSDADVSALETSMYGSQSNSKDFVFKNGELVYTFEILGTTREVNLKR